MPSIKHVPKELRPSWPKTKLQRPDVSLNEYRKAYRKWAFAIARGRDAKIEDYFFATEYVKYTQGRSKFYFLQKSHLQRALATPKWVDIEAIASFYGNRPDGMVVDHIIPIKGKDVCGLHVPWNLQYLSSKENRAKWNK